jgi:hypothetical protein
MLTLNGEKIETLPHMDIIEDLHNGSTTPGEYVASDHLSCGLGAATPQGMSYQEVADKYETSRGSVWRIAAYYGMLKHKKNELKHMNGVRRLGWACGRPMARYKGAYPNGLLRRIDQLLAIKEDHRVLHVFSGSIHGREHEDTLDISTDENPSIIADARETFPILTDTYDFTIADPPYDWDGKEGRKQVTVNYGQDMWKTEPVKPYSFVKETIRVTKPKGYFLVLHHLVYITPKHGAGELEGTHSCRRACTISVTCGPNTRVRVLNIFQKLEEACPCGKCRAVLAGRDPEYEPEAEAPLLLIDLSD